MPDGIERKAYATCVDTGKTYDLGLKEDQSGQKYGRPQIWQVGVRVRCVDDRLNNRTWSCDTVFCVERQTLVDLKMLPKARTDEEPEPTFKDRTTEELLLELLQRIGIQPTE